MLGADHVLLHLMPAEVLSKLRALALRHEQEAAFRSYVNKRLWYVVPFLSLVIIVVFMALFKVAMFLAGLFFPTPPLPEWLGLALWLVVFVLWLFLTLGLVYALFRRRESRACRDLRLDA